MILSERGRSSPYWEMFYLHFHLVLISFEPLRPMDFVDMFNFHVMWKLFNFHGFWDCPVFLLLLISSLIQLCSENMFCTIIIIHLWRLVLWPRMWPWWMFHEQLKKKMHFAAIGCSSTLCASVTSRPSCYSLFLLIFPRVGPSGAERGRGRPPA